MNRDLLESQWPQIREILSQKFTNLTDEDIRQINGHYDQLVAKLQQKYGYSREEAEERIRNWNFDRFSSSKEQVSRDYRRDDYRARKEEDNSTLWKWLLGLGIPLLLLGSWFLATSPERTAERTAERATTNQQFVVESPSDRLIIDGLRNSFAQQGFTGNIQNVQFTARNGVITLSGTVADRETRNFIENTARNYSGVRQVINNLQVR